jgi:hypothetical protein
VALNPPHRISCLVVRSCSVSIGVAIVWLMLADKVR